MEWDKLKRDITEAFRDVALEDGVGYYEADAKDRYLDPSSDVYQLEKAKDERLDWMKLYTHLESKTIDMDRFCFMDAMGLRFYLPVLMLRNDNENIISMIGFYISECLGRANYTEGKYAELIALLDKRQKKVLFRYFEYMNHTGYPGYTDEELNFPFDLGEISTHGFNFMEFIKMKL